MQIGVILRNLATSQLAFSTINQANSLFKNSKQNCVLFYEDLMMPCVQPMCATMNISEIYSFNGLLISTNIENSLALINTRNQSKKVFYVWDLEWLRRDKQDFIKNVAVYNNLDLICPSYEYAAAVEKYSGAKTKKVIEDINLKEILKLYDR